MFKKQEKGSRKKTMTNLSNYADEDLLAMASADIEGELKRRGYVHGWYKKEAYAGYIYILVNPSFESLVKIGYADDVQARMKSLNRSSGLPDPFHCYAVYKVRKRLQDQTLHGLIDGLNPDIRHSQNREFFEMSKEKAYAILSAIAQINGSGDLLVKDPFHDPFFAEETGAGQKEPAEKAAPSMRRTPRTPAEKPAVCVCRGETRAFVSWKESLVWHCQMIIGVSGFSVFAETAKGLRFSSRPSKRKVFAATEEEMRGFDFYKFPQGDLYLLTNYSASSIRQINKVLDKAWPECAMAYR